MPDDVTNASPGGKHWIEHAGLWVGTIGSVVTIALTVFNAKAKQDIDVSQQKIQEVEVLLRERSARLEESKERVERYKWVLSLLPSLTEKDPGASQLHHRSNASGADTRGS